MCGTRQWITYQSYWSRYSDVDGVSAGSRVTNDDCALIIRALPFPHFKGPADSSAHDNWRMDKHPPRCWAASPPARDWRAALLPRLLPDGLPLPSGRHQTSELGRNRWLIGELFNFIWAFFPSPCTQTHLGKLFQSDVCACVFLCWHYVALLTAAVTERCLRMARFGKWNEAPRDWNAIATATAF